MDEEILKALQAMLSEVREARGGREVPGQGGNIAAIMQTLTGNRPTAPVEGTSRVFEDLALGSLMNVPQDVALGAGMSPERFHNSAGMFQEDEVQKLATAVAERLRSSRNLDDPTFDFRSMNAGNPHRQITREEQDRRSRR